MQCWGFLSLIIHSALQDVTNNANKLGLCVEVHILGPLQVNVIETTEKVVDIPVVKQREIPQAKFDCSRVFTSGVELCSRIYLQLPLLAHEAANMVAGLGLCLSVLAKNSLLPPSLSRA